jgi:hypothetical protein
MLVVSYEDLYLLEAEHLLSSIVGFVSRSLSDIFPPRLGQIWASPACSARCGGGDSFELGVVLVTFYRLRFDFISFFLAFDGFPPRLGRIWASPACSSRCSDGDPFDRRSIDDRLA